MLRQSFRISASTAIAPRLSSSSWLTPLSLSRPSLFRRVGVVSSTCIASQVVSQLRFESTSANSPPNNQEKQTSTTSEESAPGMTPEELELEKDRKALRYGLMGTFALLSSAFSIWYGLRLGSQRYVGASDSVKVAVETRGRPSLGGPFTLVSTDGEPMSQARFLGKWTFFYFGFVHCPEICPIELNRMTKVVSAVHKNRPDVSIAPLFVSCDPKRDSLMAIKEYLSVFHKDFIGLVGTPNQVAETCKSYRIYYSVPDQQAEDNGDYLIDHSIAIFLFDPQGRFVDFFGNRFTEDEITEKVLGYMDKYAANPEWTNY